MELDEVVRGLARGHTRRTAARAIVVPRGGQTRTSARC
jgi:hypothetical protein